MEKGDKINREVGECVSNQKKPRPGGDGRGYYDGKFLEEILRYAQDDSVEIINPQEWDRLYGNFIFLSSQVRLGCTSPVGRLVGSVEALLFRLRRQQAISLLPLVFQAVPVNLFPHPGLTPSHHKRSLECWKQSPSGRESVPG